VENARVSGRKALSYTHAVPDRAYPPEGSRIGVFGGTFDPPHIGHLVAAVNVRVALQLDRVLLVVANEPWQKVDERDISPAAARLELVQAATADVDGLEASDVEIVRGGPSYTADTLAELADRWPGASLWLVVGRDAALGFPTWERVDEVAARAELVVVDRPGADDAALPAAYSWRRVEIPRLDVSSTDLRARVAEGRPLDFLTPPAVVTGIARLGLYGGAPA
jgi:nicotinate-nucleotide adenylyltransferase